MRNGSLRHTATFYERSASPDAYGALDHTFSANTTTRKCSIKQRTFVILVLNSDIRQLRFDCFKDSYKFLKEIQSKETSR